MIRVFSFISFLLFAISCADLAAQNTSSNEIFGKERSLYNKKPVKLVDQPSDRSSSNTASFRVYNLLESFNADSAAKYGNAHDYMFEDAFAKAHIVIIPFDEAFQDGYKISGVVEIPPGRELRFEPGALIDVTEGGQLKGSYTFIDAGIHQIFTLASNLSQDRLDWAVNIIAYPEWFGAVPDGKTNCQPAIQKTLDVFHQNVWLTGYDYYIDGTIVLSKNNTMKIGQLTYLSPSNRSRGELFRITREPFFIEGGVILIPKGYTQWVFNVVIDRRGENDRTPRFMSGIRNCIVKGQDNLGIRDFSGMAYKGLKVSSGKENDFTYFTVFENIDFYRPDTAIYLVGHKKAGMSNSWQFNNVTIDWPMRGIVLAETAAGHVFSNLVIQPNTMFPGVMIDVASQYNTFNGMIWDIHSDSTIVLRKTAVNNWFSNMGKAHIYENFVTDYTSYKVQNTFSTASPFEPTSNGRYNYYTQDKIGIGVDNNKFSGAPQLYVGSSDSPVIGAKRSTKQTGGSLNSIKGTTSGIMSITHTTGKMSNGLGGGITFLVKDGSTDLDAFSENLMARLVARRDGHNSKGLLQFFTTGPNAALPTMTLRNSGKVGIGTTDPSSALQVDGGIQMANDTDPPSAEKAGTIRYRKVGNSSLVEICVQTGTSTYKWVTIHKETW